MTLRHLSFRLAYGNRRPEPWAGTRLPRKGSARPDLAPNWDIGAGRGPPRPLTLNRRHDRGAAIGRLTSKRRRGCGLHPGREAAEPGMRLRRRGVLIRTFTRYLSAPTSSAMPVRLVRILCEAPPSSDELIFAQSDRGFVLISGRQELGGVRRAAGPSGRLGQDRQGLQRGTSCCWAAASASRCSTAGCTWSATLRTVPPTGAKVLLQLANRLAQRRLGVWFRAGAGRRCSSSANRDERDNQRISIDLLPAGRQHHGRTTGRENGPKLFG